MAGNADEELIRAAIQAMGRAYAPYSRFSVGAAVRGESGRVFSGVNVENAAYPVGNCAEASAIAAMILHGDRRILGVAVAGGHAGDGALCTPCGACRQRLREFAAPDIPIHVCGPEGLRRTFALDELLPCSFGPENLSETREETP